MFPLRGLSLPGTLGTVNKASGITLVEFEGTSAVKPAKSNSDRVKNDAVSDSHEIFITCRIRRKGIFCGKTWFCQDRDSNKIQFSNKVSSIEPLPSIFKPLSSTPLS